MAPQGLGALSPFSFWTGNSLNGRRAFLGFSPAGVGFGGGHDSAKSSLCLIKSTFFPQPATLDLLDVKAVATRGFPWKSGRRSTKAPVVIARKIV
jgi:hypothetical protein